MRYRFYRVHKYVCFELSEFERASAKVNFLDTKACVVLKEQWNTLVNMLKHHGEYEDEHIHDLLRQKNSELALNIEQEHEVHEEAFQALTHQLEAIIASEDLCEKIIQGNEFYLAYRLFYSQMLKHLYDEETVLLPALQALYSDEELAKLQAKTYEQMAPEHMLGMLNAIFLHANPEDMYFFANEMKKAEPEKFNIVWDKLLESYKQSIHDYEKAISKVYGG